MSSAKKKPPAGASELLRAAVLDMGVHSSFQSVLLSKRAGCLSAFLGIRRGQTDGEAAAVDLESQTALFAIVGLPAQVGISDDCRKAFIHVCDLRKLKDYRYLLVLSCKDSTEIFQFEVRLSPVTVKEV